MAELTTDPTPRTSSACCSPDAQAICCEPSEKPGLLRTERIGLQL